MARVAVIGEPPRIHGYGLPDAILCPATDQAEAVLAWRGLPDDIDVAVLTPNAARWLASEIAGRPGVLPVLLADAAVAGASGAAAGGLPEPGARAEIGALGGCGRPAYAAVPAVDADTLPQPRRPPDVGDLPGSIPPQSP